MQCTSSFSNKQKKGLIISGTSWFVTSPFPALPLHLPQQMCCRCLESPVPREGVPSPPEPGLYSFMEDPCSWPKARLFPNGNRQLQLPMYNHRQLSRASIRCSWGSEIIPTQTCRGIWALLFRDLNQEDLHHDYTHGWWWPRRTKQVVSLLRQ